MSMISACQEGRSEEVSRRLDNGEDVNTTLYGFTILMASLQAGQLTVVKLLHSRRADFTTIDNNGCNALHRAAMGGNVDCIEFVLNSTKIDVNSQDEDDGDTPLMFTIDDHLMASILLVERGANLFARNNKGDRAIDRPLGPQVLQHAKTLLWESVKPLILLSSAACSTTSGSSTPLINVLTNSDLIRKEIGPYLLRTDLIVRDPSIPKEDREPDEVKRRIEAALAAAGGSSSNGSSSSISSGNTMGTKRSWLVRFRRWASNSNE
jgi:hypothetical protein